jgi:trimethylamine:corrinoid methyltransferase-like protein
MCDYDTQIGGNTTVPLLEVTSPRVIDVPAENRYGVAVDVKRAAALYAEGWTLRQIGAELRLTETTVSDQLRRAGVRGQDGRQRWVRIVDLRRAKSE